MKNLREKSLLIVFVFFYFSTCSSSILYPSLDDLINHLYSNSTLPDCTSKTCQTTSSQAKFSQGILSDEHLRKLASYDRFEQNRIPSSSPFLVASTGIYRGKRLKYRNRYIDQFLGIYYADPPKSLKKPVKKSFVYSIFDATKPSPCCMQSLTMAENLSYGSFMMHQDFDEDCLSLNIYRADLRYGEKRKAIMIFSHGGSNQLGSGSLFDGSILASEGDLIVVTMNFRLNYHGFLSSGDHRIRGNYGLWDQLLAVEWIHENAHLFGGDPNRIVLAGHSAGAGNVMLIPASPYCRGMIRRVISQSGTGLAPWSINRQPMKLLERFSQEFKCSTSNETQMVDCLTKVLKENSEEIYRLHLSLSIADDNPYPVIDNDFINDTMDNLIQTKAFHNVDFLTGVTLNEGLYFAEYHIKHLYITLLNQTASKLKQNTNLDAISAQDPSLMIEHFTTMNFLERYIGANFEHADCFLKDVKNRYDLQDQNNITYRLKLYIDLVSDLMFNFHMVRCLNLLSKISIRNSSTYAYIYSHRPTYKVRSVLRDQLKLLPDAIGHFAELDYVFGVPLVRNNTRFHQNVNFSYYNYSKDEELFSRQIIEYWANFVKTGNPNQGSFGKSVLPARWQSYTANEHNYLYFQMKNFRAEPNYFDSMFQFWTECFQIENEGGCQKSFSNNKSMGVRYFRTLAIVLSVLFGLLLFYFLGKYIQHRRKAERLFSSQSGTFLSHPHTATA